MQTKPLRYIMRVCVIIGFIIAINYVDNKLAPTNAKPGLQMVAIGDSLTYGSGDPKRVGYIGRVQQHLVKVSGKQVILHRYGVRGYRTDQIKVYIQDVHKRQTIRQANYIFLYIGTNDFIQAARRDFNTMDPDIMEEKRKIFQKNLSGLVAQIRRDNQFAPLVMVGMYDPYGNLLNHDRISKILESWNNTTKGMTSAFPNTYYVSTNDLFLQINKDLYFSDIIHPNPKGYELLSNRVIKSMKQRGLIQ